MSYDGFYTKQEQEDALVTQISNPNRVGSGFINLGPQQRFPQGPAANWQTSSLVGAGGAPQQVSEIWNAPKPPGHQLPPAPASLAMPFAHPGGQFPTGSSQSAGHVNALFNTFHIDPAAACAPSMMQAAAQAQQPFMAAPGLDRQGMPQNLQRLVNGGLPRGAPQQPGLVSMMHTKIPTAGAPTQRSAAPLGNGAIHQQASGMHAAFAPQNSMVPHHCGLAPHSANFSSANAFTAQPLAQPRASPPAPPVKVLHSASDYAAAAQQWKPPPPPRGTQTATSVSRKAESETSASSAPRSGSTARVGAPPPPSSSHARPAAQSAQDWECRRCTFINNCSLWECEMCGFERPGSKPEQPATHHTAAQRGPPQDPGWQTATQQRRPAQTAQTGAAHSAKTKAQAKNEKRRSAK